jgi:hypothetical protein
MHTIQKFLHRVLCSIKIHQYIFFHQLELIYRIHSFNLPPNIHDIIIHPTTNKAQHHRIYYF